MASFNPLRRLAALALIWAALASTCAAADDNYPDPPGRVAMVNVAEGQVSLSPAASDTWTTDVRNRPLGSGDKLWTDLNSRADVKVGSTSVRLGPQTGIELLGVDDSRLQLRLSAGTVQLHVRRLDPGQSLELATPAGAVTVLRPGTYRLDVADGVDDLRVEVMRGQAEVATQARTYTLETGQLGEYAGGGSAQTTSLLPADDFDNWATALDQRDDRSVAARYVSADVPGYSELDDYGDWANYPTYGAVWVPRVAVDYVPYRDGHWAWIAPWGWTWVDSAPWGFVPFHYGRWVSLGGRWGWCPGPIGPRAYFAPALVGWIGGHGWNEGYAGRAAVGWFPLGWNEPYRPSYRASAAYARELNLANTQLTRTYLNNNLGADNYRAQAPGWNNARYANQSVRGAVTLVPRETVTTGAPVAAAARNLSAIDLSRVPAQAGPPGLEPAAPPNGALWSRPVLARSAPRAASAAASVRVLSLPPRPAPGGAYAAGATPPATYGPAGSVPRAYADRPPYAQQPAARAGNPPPGSAAERAHADRPWSERPEAQPRPQPAYRAPPQMRPEPPARAPSQPERRAVESHGRPEHMSRAVPHAALSHHYATAYHPGSPGAPRHYHR